MKSLLQWHVLSEMTARRFAWCAGFVLLAVCTALVVKMLPELGVWAGIGLVSSVVLAWVVVGAQFPRMMLRT